MTGSFRLMTANLLNVRSDPAALATLLERFDPDVIVAQELGPFAAEVIAGRYPNHHLRPALDSTGRGAGSRLEARFGDLPTPVRPFIQGKIEAAGTTLNMASIHLTNPIDFPWWRSVSERTQQLQALFAWADALQGPILVAGDINASPRWPAYKRIARRWDDLVADYSIRSGVRPERTWGPIPGWPRLLRIDHVFGSGVSASGTGVHRVEGSDHWAVVVDLELRSPTHVE